MTSELTTATYSSKWRTHLFAFVGVGTGDQSGHWSLYFVVYMNAYLCIYSERKACTFKKSFVSFGGGKSIYQFWGPGINLFFWGICFRAFFLFRLRIHFYVSLFVLPSMELVIWTLKSFPQCRRFYPRLLTSDISWSWMFFSLSFGAGASYPFPYQSISSPLIPLLGW